MFNLIVRPVTEADLSLSTPFVPDVDEYEMYLRALCEELSLIKEIEKVTQDESSLSIETNVPLTEEELKSRIKPVFTQEIMGNLRFVSLAKL